MGSSKWNGEYFFILGWAMAASKVLQGRFDFPAKAEWARRSQHERLLENREDKGPCQLEYSCAYFERSCHLRDFQTADDRLKAIKIDHFAISVFNESAIIGNVLIMITYLKSYAPEWPMIDSFVVRSTVEHFRTEILLIYSLSILFKIYFLNCF